VAVSRFEHIEPEKLDRGVAFWLRDSAVYLTLRCPSKEWIEKPLFNRSQTHYEYLYESPGALLPITAGAHVGDADHRPQQIGGVNISSQIAVLFARSTSSSIAPWTPSGLHH
jgi:hypothetical protein